MMSRLRALHPLLAGALVIGAAACSSGDDQSSFPPLPPLGPQTIADPLAYLVEGTKPGDAAHPLRPGDAMTYRRQDMGGYQDEDAYLLPDGSAALDWSYPPFGAFDVDHGDGGEHYTVADGEVDIVATQDGSKPGIVQHFAGWVAFRTDATSAPICGVAPIRAYTCYWRQTVAFPEIGKVDTIISQHYNTRNQTRAGALEVSFWGRGYGRLAWQAWRRAGRPVDPQRCPDFGFNAPPRPDLVLTDCRENVNIVPEPDPLKPAQLWQP
jgi:hypothetical protein